MPEGKRIESDSSSLAARSRGIDRSVRFVHRPSVQPPKLRSMDGISLVTSPLSHGLNVSKPPPQPLMIKKVVSGTDAKPRLAHVMKPALPRQSRSVVLTRQMVQKKPKKRIPHVSHRSGVSALLVMMAVAVFASGSFVAYMGWNTHKKAAAQAEVLSRSTDNKNSGDVPAEDAVDADILKAYQVSPASPRVIKIPRLKIDARVKPLSLKDSGDLMAPDNINDVGWYDGSSKPGENGAVLVDGHVQGPTKPGVFYRLTNLKEGDTVEIERGDGKLITYKVVMTESVDQDKVNMTKALTSIDPSKPGLNLITCTGRYDVRTNKYEQRLIIYTVQQ
ncbi:class F sortase [Candidatus Saccharibacteria bacterium]|nr:class F sortase [Candidatus Saccharibacteria bacterium]